MHKFLIVYFLLMAGLVAGQSPQKISYQGVARSASGSVLSNTTIAVKFDIRRDSPGGTIVFTEEHQGSTGLSTNTFGLFTTAIGGINSLGAVDWAAGPFFIEVSIDPANGTSYNSVGAQQLMSVPYALYAEKAGNAAPVPTISVNAPNTVTNTSAGSYSITIPASMTYSAGNGIDISGGVISSTVSIPTPTITGGGQATITSPSANSYVVNVPTPSLSISGNSITISSGNTQLLPENTITAGNSNFVVTKAGYDYTLTPVTPSLNVSGGSLTGVYPTQTLTIPSSSTSLAAGNTNVTLTQSGNAYTITPVTPTLNVSGGTLTGSYPVQTLTIPSSSTSLVQGTNVALNQSGNTYTVSSVTPTLNVNGGTLTGSYPLQTLTIPSSSTSLVQGTNVALNQSGNTYTVSSVTPTLNVNGGTLTGSYPLQTLTIPSSSTSLVQGTNVALNQSGNTYTVSSVTPTLNVNGGTLTGSYPVQTLTIPSSSTSLAAGNTNVTLTQSGNAYTITPVTPTLNVNGGTLTGSYPAQTLTIPSSSTSLAAGNTNVTLTQSGNAYTITPVTPTLNVNGGTLTGSYPTQTLTIPSSSTTLVPGANVTLNQNGNTYTISALTNTYTGTAGSIDVTGNTINLLPTGVSAGTYGSAVSNAVPTFSVDNFGRLTTAGQYTPTIFGDVTGTVNTSTVSKLRGVPLSAVVPVTGQVLQYDGSAWTPTLAASGWNLTGNSGTTASHFIGTTDLLNFRIRTNSLDRAVFSTDNNLTLFGGDNANPGRISMNGNISNTIKVMEAVTSNNGSALSVVSGDSKTGTGNSFGGNLNLSSGATTGNGTSGIDFLTAGGGTTGSTRMTAGIKMRLNGTGQLLIGNSTGFGTNSKLIVEEGHIESKQATAPGIAGAGSLLGLAGSTAALSSNSTDVCGTILINIGLLGGAKGSYATITFDRSYANPPVIILTPRTEESANARAYVTSTTAGGFTLAFSTSTAGLTTYEFNYMILESN